MGADQVLRGAHRLPIAQKTHGAARRPQADAIPFEDLSEQWRSMPRNEGIKKIFFLVSLAAFLGYYAFLAFLILLR